MKPTDTKHSKNVAQHFPIVGIGASEGGLDAIKKVVKAIRPDSGMAYVIVQHLSANNSDSLAELLTPFTDLPVQEIINAINLVPNHIYIIPENNNLIAQEGVLKLHQRTRNEKSTSSIDIFFESLAEVHQSFTIGVILSGTAFDGTFGFKKIKEAGGTTLVQDPETAEFKGMPQSAIDADVVDYVLAPELIAAHLLEIKKSYATNHAFSEEEHLPKGDEEIVLQIIHLILSRTGNDFGHYKQFTIRRGIAKRMVVSRKENLQDYYYHLRNDKTEQDLLFNDFLIPLTYFFRDQNFFESLPKLAFPQLVQNTVNNNLRIWIAGCATGEEAYSLAIALHEYLSERNSDIKIQIFASDISEKYIAKARTAIYTAQDVQHVSPTRLQHYFTKRDGHYHLNKLIRDRCIFAVHDLLKDPPFARIDLVSCRNVLRYLDSYLQNKVLNSFHYSLNDEGILFLGKDEDIDYGADLFTNHPEAEKIFVRLPSREKHLSDSIKSASKDQKKSQEVLITELTSELAEANAELIRIKSELKTATDHLQSNTTELLYVNEELVDRQQQLLSMRNYSESIIDMIREPLLIIDQDFFIKSANPAFYKYFETTPKETEGHSFFEIGDCQWDIPEFKELLLKRLVEKDIVEDFKIDTICTGLGKKIMVVNARRIINTQSPGMILLAIEDITDLEITNAALTKKNRELEIYNEELKTFSSAASHDLQEPLRKIQIFSERILDHEKNLTASSLHHLERIRIASSGMSKLVTGLIDYSRINFIEKEYKRTDLNVLLKKIFSDLKQDILEKSAVITVSPLPQANVIPHQIQQLFTTLIVNALQFTEENLIPQLKIENQHPSREEISKIGGNPEISYTKICVIDNGIGFTKEYENKIFDPFYRLHNNEKYKGSGLGLTIAKKVVSNHNGFITVESKVNHGTTFSLYIPL